MQTVRTNLNIYYAQLQVAEVAEDVDEVEGEPGGHEHEDHADQEVHRPLTSGVASAGGGGGAGPGPEGELNQTSWPYFGVKLSCVCLKQPLTILRGPI